MELTHGLNVHEMTPLMSPRALKAALPLTEAAQCTVMTGRKAVQRILRKEDPRLLVIIGPCSIHDPEAALNYAVRLNALREELTDHLCLVMRVYYEKPRTTVGWKGLLYDPHLDGSHDLAAGLRLARQLLLTINAMGLPAGTEMLDLVTPQYYADLNTCPSVNQDGQLCLVRTTGNPWGHVVLRGGTAGPNYEAPHLAQATHALQRSGHEPVLLVDCSHANAKKQHACQEDVWHALVAQRVAGNRHVIGMMVESNIGAGSQPLPADRRQLRYGVSITDPCVDWQTTERMLRYAHAQMGAAL